MESENYWREIGRQSHVNAGPTLTFIGVEKSLTLNKNYPVAETEVGDMVLNDVNVGVFIGCMREQFKPAAQKG